MSDDTSLMKASVIKFNLKHFHQHCIIIVADLVSLFCFVRYCGVVVHLLDTVDDVLLVLAVLVRGGTTPG